jgi:hypothetical protein
MIGNMSFSSLNVYDKNSHVTEEVSLSLPWSDSSQNRFVKVSIYNDDISAIILCSGRSNVQNRNILSNILLSANISPVSSTVPVPIGTQICF